MASLCQTYLQAQLTRRGAVLQTVSVYTMDGCRREYRLQTEFETERVIYAKIDAWIFWQYSYPAPE